MGRNECAGNGGAPYRFFDISYEKITIPLVTPVEHLPQYRAFIYSDKEFRPNTKAPVEIIGDKPFPLRCENLDEAKEKLVTSINKFFFILIIIPVKLRCTRFLAF